MSTNRSFIALRKKRIALFIGLAVIAVVSLYLSPVPETQACGESPVPLRQVYMMSERVVVARAGQSALLQTEKVGEEADYQRTLLRTTFYVSKTLKGEGEDEQIVHFYQWLWGEDRNVPENYAEGQTLLLFLSKSQDADGYELSHTTYGEKKLSEDALKIYVTRIEELSKILREEKPDKEKIVEWLVRLVEEPATRWEGAYELSTSQYFLNREKEGASEQPEEGAVAEEAAETAETTEESTEASNSEEAQEVAITGLSIGNVGGASEEDLSIYNGEAARLLTEDQKKRLSNVFFGLKEFTDEDMLLFDLVEAWDDERLVPFVFSQLEKLKAEPPYYVEQLVTTLAKKLQSETVTRLAERYCEYAAYYDEGNVPVNGGKEGDEEEKSLSGNSAEKRRARLQKFLVEAERARGNRIAMAQ